MHLVLFDLFDLDAFYRIILLLSSVSVPEDCQPRSTITFSKSVEVWMLKAPRGIVLQGFLPISGYLSGKTYHEKLRAGFLSDMVGGF